MNVGDNTSAGYYELGSLQLEGKSMGIFAEGAIDNVRNKIPQRHDQSRAVKLGEASNGYCPLCGHWSIITNVKNQETEEINDICSMCGTVFEPSGLTFTDSQMCTCGHPKDYHDKNALSCIKGKASSNCQCDKYKPTEVHVSP